MRTSRITASVAALLVPCILAAAVPASAAPSKKALKARLLTLSDLPSGWNATAPSTSKSTKSGIGGPGCLSVKSPKGYVTATAAFHAKGTFPIVDEGLATGPNAASEWKKVNRTFAKCKALTISTGGKSTRATLRPLSFPRVGSQSAAYRLSFSVTKVTFDSDLVLFQTGAYVGAVTYSNVGPVPLAAAEQVVRTAVAKAAGTAG
jgi:hypothetical protein